MRVKQATNANAVHVDPASAVCRLRPAWRLLAVLLLAVVRTSLAQHVYTPYLPVLCSKDNNFTAGSTYQVNIDKLVHRLRDGAASNKSFFYTNYDKNPDMAFGLVVCSADYTWENCLSCLDHAVAWVGAGCPYSRNVSVNYDMCLLWYSDKPFFDGLDLTRLMATVRSLTIATDSASMNDPLLSLIRRISVETVASPGLFAYGNQSYVDSQGLLLAMYALAQCRQDLGSGECLKCLNNVLEGLGKAVPEGPPPRGKWKLIKVIMMVASGSIAGTVVLLLCLGVSGSYFLRWRKGRTKSAGSLTFFRGEAVEIVELEQGTGSKRFSYDELAAATDNFSDNRKLGEGGFGSVYRGFLEELKLPVAVKRVSKSSRQGWKEFTSEVKIISRLRHRNLVLLIGWCRRRPLARLRADAQRQCGQPPTPTGPQEATGMVDQILLGLGSALVYLHHETEQCVVHRDIKPSNVMLDVSFNAKLGDFGLARVIDDGRRSRTTTLAGTTGYMDPECVATGRTSVHVHERVCDVRCVRAPAVVDQPCEPEVTELGIVRRIQHHVAGLHVPMHDAALRVLVQMRVEAAVGHQLVDEEQLVVAVVAPAGELHQVAVPEPADDRHLRGELLPALPRG
ncbi:hypothetical protein EJB05_00459, partial [Eragrostis curvula]